MVWGGQVVAAFSARLAAAPKCHPGVMDGEERERLMKNKRASSPQPEQR